MSNVVTTLTIDARGAEEGSARYIRAHREAQAAADRSVDAEDRARVAREKATVATVGFVTATGGAARGWDKLRAAVDPTVTTMKRIEQATLDADRAVRRGITTEQEAARVLALRVAQLNGSADAARAAAREMDALARQDLGNIAKVDDYLARISAEAGTLTRAMNPLLVAQEKYNASVDQANRLARQSLISEETRRSAIEASRRALEQAGTPTGTTTTLQRSIDRISTDSHSGGSARESASVFEADEKVMVSLRAEAARLTASLNPVGAAYDQMTGSIARYEDMARRSIITDDQLVAFKGQATQAFDEFAGSLSPVGEKAKLTGNQLLNLSRQGNDAITMFAAGSPIYQIAATQIGQVVGALEENPKGLRGSLEAIKDGAVAALAGINPLIAGFAATATAAAAYVFFSRKEMKPLTDVISEQNRRVKALAESYGVAAKAAEDYRQRAPASIRFEADLGAENDLKRLQFEAQKLVDMLAPEAVVPDAVGGVVRARSLEFAELGAAVAEFQRSVQAGRPDVIGLADDIGRVAEGSTNKDLRTFVQTVTDAASAVIPLQGGLETAKDTMLEFSRNSEKAGASLKAARSEMEQFLPKGTTASQDIEANFRRQLGAIEQMRMSPRARQGAVAQAIREGDAAMAELARPARESLKAVQDSLNNLDLSPVNRQIAETTQEYERRIEAYKASTNDAAGIASLLAEKEAALGMITKTAAREEASRRAGYDLDLKSIGDRTNAQRAETDAQRAYIDAVARGEDASVAAARAGDARTLSLARSNAALVESQRQRIEGGQAQVEQAQFELTLVDKSAAETARLTAEYQMLTGAKEAARAAGGVVGDDEIAAIQAQAAAIGEATGALQRLNFERDIAFDRQQASRSPEEQEIAERLRSMGVAYESAQGKADAAQLRLNNRLHETNDLIADMRDDGKEAFLDLVDAIGSGEDALGAFAGAFAGLGRQLASGGFDKLFAGLFGATGSAGGASGGLGSIVSALANAAKVSDPVASSPFVPTPTPRPSYTSPAVKASSDKLAEGVTQAVSSNLLSSILGAGKSASHINGLNTNFANALTSMLDAAPDAVRSAVTINSGFRSVARQAELFDAALKKYGSVAAARKWVAPPGNSKHNVGMAADLGYGSGATKDWIHANAGKFGLAFPLGNEDWHIELASARGGNTKAIEKGVSQGVQQGLKATAYDQGGYDAGSPRNPSGGAQPMTGMQRGLGAIGAGLGIFGQGYESGSPLSGGVSGALGGFQAAQALGVAGPIGMVAGAALGILGGVLGGRAKRKAAHQEAAKKWEEVRPQYEAFDRSLSGEGVGQLRTQNEELWGQLNSFMQVGGAAWKMGSGNSSAQFASTGTKMFQKIHDSMKEFREGFSYMVEDLSGGQGLEGEFAKGRANVKALGEQVKGFIDDVKIAWGSADNGLPTGAPGDAIDKEWKTARDAAVEKAKAAAGAYALTMLYTADTTSDVQKAIDSFRGTAAGLQPILEKLGWSADEAAKAIDGRLTQALTKMRGDFEQGILDEVNGLDGKGYLAEVREMIKAFEQTKKDAELLGADTSLLPKLFELQGQAIVDGAELTGEAFTDLITAFPSLAGVVHEFVDEVTRTASQLKDVIAGYDDRTFAATNDGGGLSGQLGLFDRQAQKEREAETAAGGKAMAELERALAAERLKIVRDNGRQIAMAAYDASKAQLQSLYDGLDTFSDSLKDFLSGMKIGESSTLSMKDQLAESRKVYEETLAKANGGDADARDKLLGVTQTYLDQAKGYFVSSEAYGKIFDEVQTSLKATDVKTTSQLDLMRSSATWLEKISANTLTVADALADYLAAEKTLNTARNWGDPGFENRNKAIIGDLTKAGISYTGDFGGGKFLDWTNAQLPSQQAIISAIVEKYDRQFQLNGYDPKYKGTPLYKGMHLGGLVGAYADGGIVGNGIWNRDSVLARYAGGGHIGLAGGEFVMPAPRVTPATMPVLEAMRSGRTPGNDNAGVVQAVDRLSSIMERVVVAVAGTGESTRQEIEILVGETRSVGRELKKAGGAPR